MTRFDPQLMLTRLLIFRAGAAVYDERFHSGVNIIRGKNSTGKSTLADMIFYALGGESIAWKKEASLCDFVLAEVRLNGRLVTLKREISTQRDRPMSIFWGDLESAQKNAVEGWEQYPYSQKGGKQSFSQVLFRALNIPQARGELASQITMHQLLRLAYSDQRTAFDEIFRHDNFDKKLVRDAVGSLLCGFYDERLYDAEFRLREVTAEHSSIAGRLTQLSEILGSQGIEVEMLTETVKQKQAERNALYAEVRSSQARQSIETKADAELVRRAQEAEQALREINLEVVDSQQKLERLNFEISDSEQFLEALKEKSAALDESLLTRSVFGELLFEHCPACHQDLEEPSDPNACPLCKKQQTSNPNDSQFLRLKQELALQIDESQKLQARRMKAYEDVAKALPALRLKQEQLRLKYRDIATVTSSAEQALVQDEYRKIGYIEREIEDLQQRIQLASTVRELSNRKAILAAEISKLEDEIETRRSHRESREREAKNAIAHTMAELLRRDLDREKTFKEVDLVYFSFADNEIEINERKNYSASSMVIIKNSFHLALLMASVRKAFFRYFRFALFDNVEDKGMEEGRSRNFQRLIVEMSEKAEVEHQIIFTTSMIDPELDRSGLVVGESYTPSNKSLKMG